MVIFIFTIESGTDAGTRACRLVCALNFENFFLDGKNIVIYSYS